MKKKAILIVTTMILAITIIIVNSSPSKELHVTENDYNDYKEQLAIYIEGTNGMYNHSDSIPSKDSDYIINSSKTVCDGSAKIRWDNDSWSAKISNFKEKNTKCYIYFDKPSSTSITIKATIDGAASNTFPSKTSGYIADSVSCTNGVNGTFDYEKWQVEVETLKETTCTVNFGKIDSSIAAYLKTKKCTGSPSEKCLVEENGLRFEGKNPDNYVLFNNELWRIIGVFSVNTESNGKQDLVKIIRDNIIGDIALDKDNENVWSTSTLKEQLNDGYYNSSSGVSCYFAISDDLTSIITKPCEFEKKGLNETSIGMIESASWNIGGNTSTKMTTDAMYQTEVAATWTGKVGLMNVSDFGYSVLASSCARTTNLYDYNTSNCAGNSWMYGLAKQRTMNPKADSTTDVSYIHNNGYASNKGAKEGYGVRPVVYLNSSVKVLGGAGTKDLPYIISN